MAYNKSIDDYTVEQLLSLSEDELRHFSKADMSRAVRTAALAANKRLNRLLNQAKKQGDQFVVKKSAKHQIATDALNFMLDEQRKRTGQTAKKIDKFGVGNKSSKQELHAELGRIRTFMNLKTSTIKGATDVRKAREKKATGKTREDILKDVKKKGKRSGKTLKEIKAEQKAAVEKYEQNLSSVYAELRKYIELYEPDSMRKDKDGKYVHFDGSTEVLDAIASRIMNDEENYTFEELNDISNSVYEENELLDQESLEDELYDEGITLEL